MYSFFRKLCRRWFSKHERELVICDFCYKAQYTRSTTRLERHECTVEGAMLGFPATR